MFCIRWWSPIVAGAMWHNVAHYGTMWQDHNVLSQTLRRNTIPCARGTSPWRSFFTFTQILPFVAGEGLCCQMQYGKAWREAKWGLHFRNSLYRWNLEFGQKWSRCDYKWEIFHLVQHIGKLCHHFMHININFGSLRFIGSSSKSSWVRIFENLSLVSHLESLELDLEILAHELPGDVVLPPVRGDRQLVHWRAGPDEDHLVSRVVDGDGWPWSFSSCCCCSIVDDEEVQWTVEEDRDNI